MLTDRKTPGPKPTYPFRDMAVDDVVTLPAPTSADVKRIARNASQYGLRHGRVYQCLTDPTTTGADRVMMITRTK